MKTLHLPALYLLFALLFHQSSKGPDEPIADNATTEGKAKNRRTVVTIQ